MVNHFAKVGDGGMESHPPDIQHPHCIVVPRDLPKLCYRLHQQSLFRLHQQWPLCTLRHHHAKSIVQCLPPVSRETKRVFSVQKTRCDVSRWESPQNRMDHGVHKLHKNAPALEKLLSPKVALGHRLEWPNWSRERFGSLYPPVN